MKLRGRTEYTYYVGKSGMMISMTSNPAEANIFERKEDADVSRVKIFGPSGSVRTIPYNPNIKPDQDVIHGHDSGIF